MQKKPMKGAQTSLLPPGFTFMMCGFPDETV